MRSRIFVLELLQVIGFAVMTRLSLQRFPGPFFRRFILWRRNVSPRPTLFYCHTQKQRTGTGNLAS